MLYMFLITYDPNVPRDPSQPPSLQPAHARLEQELRERGVYVSGAALMPAEGVPPVRVKDGRVMATDGPFAETRELTGRLLHYRLQECRGDRRVRQKDSGGQRQLDRCPADRAIPSRPRACRASVGTLGDRDGDCPPILTGGGEKCDTCS